MKLSLILEAVNRMSRPLDQGRRSVDQLGRSSKEASGSIGAMDRRMEGAVRTTGALDRRMNAAGRSARQLGNAGETMGHRIAAGARRGAVALAGLERRMQLSNATMGALAYKAGGLIGGALRTGAVAGVAVGGAVATGGLMKIISAGTQAETLKTQLVQGRSGDVKAAERDLAWIQDFAAKTPYDLADVSAAFISARNAGIDPMNGSLMAMGDAASALGKTYGDAIGMMMDAQQDEFARLPEFGIKAAKKGDTATFRYFDRSGKAMVKSVKMAGHNVEQALTEILRDKYGGGMEAIAKTTGGKWANLNDKITQRAVNVWNGGFGAEVQRQLDRATKAFDDAERNGSADRWSKSTSQALAGVVKTMGDADWEGFAKDVKGVAGAFVELGTFAGWAAGKLGELRKWMADKELKADQYTGFLGSIEYSNGGLVPHAPGWAKRLFGGSKSSAGAKAQGLAPFKDRNAAQAAGKMRFPSRFADVPFMDPSKPQGSEADHKKARDAIWRDALRQRNRSLPPPRGQAPAGARPAPAPTGKIALHVTADRGLTVRPTKVAASGMALDVNTGRAMGGFA